MIKKSKISIVDYGLGNLHSLLKAIQHFTEDVEIISTPEEIKIADFIIIPGVGAFAAGMEGLEKRNLVEPLQEFAKSGKPMLGICLGAQLLFEKGFEFGEVSGLSIIPGTVEMFPDSVSKLEKIPQIGWNEIYSQKKSGWETTIFEDLKDHSAVYFVHSYIMLPTDSLNTLACAEYGGLEFSAVVKKGNVYGTQFHPEKSGEIGLTILKNFITLPK